MNLKDIFKQNDGGGKGIEDESSITARFDTRGPIRLGLWILVIGFGGLLLWASLAPLDEGVPCTGMVSISTKRKVVQHLHGGTVTEVVVHEGQFVRKGALLLSLDSLTSKARYTEVHQHYLGLRAQEARLQAEQRGSSSIILHADLLHDPDRGLVRDMVTTQKELLASRLTAMRLMKEQRAAMAPLVKDGYAPVSQLRDIDIKIAQLQSESASQLAQVQNEVQADAEKSTALAEELRETAVKAPVDGQVVGLQVQTVGAVIQPGQKLMDIVPKDEPLIIEAKIAPHLIDKVHPGLVATVQFASFANSPQLLVSGKVDSVSGDLLSEAAPGVPGQPAMQAQSYYLARVHILPEGLKELGSRKMHPGMPVQVIIKTGERTVLAYIMHPLFKRMSAMLKEE